MLRTLEACEAGHETRDRLTTPLPSSAKGVANQIICVLCSSIPYKTIIVSNSLIIAEAVSMITDQL